MLDLDDTATYGKLQKKDIRWERYISFSAKLHRHVVKALSDHAGVTVSNTKRFLATMTPFQVMEAILYGLKETVRSMIDNT